MVKRAWVVVTEDRVVFEADYHWPVWTDPSYRVCDRISNFGTAIVVLKGTNFTSPTILTCLSSLPVYFTAAVVTQLLLGMSFVHVLTLSLSSLAHLLKILFVLLPRSSATLLLLSNSLRGFWRARMFMLLSYCYKKPKISRQTCSIAASKPVSH